MRPIDEALLPLIDRIYEAVDHPEQWPEVIAALGAVIGGRRDFWHADEGARPPSVSALGMEAGCHGTFFLSRDDLRVLDDYAQDFGELIIRFLKIVFLSTLWSQKEVSAREAIGLKITERYLQTCAPMQSNAASPAARSAGRKLIAALWEEGRVFGNDSLRAMRLLIPHFDRALRLQMRLNASDLHANMVSGTLDWLALGVVLVDHAGMPLWSNRRARQIMERGNALQVSSTGLVGHSPSVTRDLRALVQGVVSAGTQGLLALDRGVNLRPLLLIAMPLNSRAPAAARDADSGSAFGVLFLSDPDFDSDPSARALRQAFGLTDREAQAAIAVARGSGLKAAATSLGVAPTTARTLLQRAFAKTGTNHQAELAALVHRMLAPVRRD